eukprot:scaffold44147_cov28-Attheya_sp.AAC.1
MPYYEFVLEEDINIGSALRDPNLTDLQKTNAYSDANVVDVSGRRVDSYINLVWIAEDLKSQRKHLSQPDKLYEFKPKFYLNCPRRRMLGEIVKRERNENGIYGIASSFQKRAVKCTRGVKPKGMLMPLTVSPEDETTNLGTMKIVLTALQQCGLLILNPEGTDPTYTGPALVTPPFDELEKLYVMFLGDGLSQLRFNDVKKKLWNVQAKSFIDTYEQTVEIVRALTHCIYVNGDLHGGRFHTLSVAYITHFGGFIQPIQVALGVKRICAKKVEKCYQQCEGLVLKDFL